MTKLEKILHDLSISQTTASSLAPRVDMPESAVVVCLQQLEAQGKVESLLLNGIITVYRLKSS
jgi:hypothetical protein